MVVAVKGMISLFFPSSPYFVLRRRLVPELSEYVVDIDPEGVK